MTFGARRYWPTLRTRFTNLKRYQSWLGIIGASRCEVPSCDFSTESRIIFLIMFFLNFSVKFHTGGTSSTAPGPFWWVSTDYEHVHIVNAFAPENNAHYTPRRRKRGPSLICLNMFTCARQVHVQEIEVGLGNFRHDTIDFLQVLIYWGLRVQAKISKF